MTYARVAVIGMPDLAPLPALTRVEGKYHRFRLLRKSDTDNAAPSEHSNDVAPELVSSLEEDEDDRPGIYMLYTKYVLGIYMYTRYKLFIFRILQKAEGWRLNTAYSAVTSLLSSALIAAPAAQPQIQTAKGTTPA